MTEIGNPQNAFIAIRSGIPFLEYTAIMLPVTLACLVVAIVFVWAAFRKELATPLTNAQAPSESRLEKRGLALTLTIVVGAVTAFFVTTPAWLPAIALAGGVLVLFFLPFVTRVTPWKLVARTDWSIILFFIGLFVVLGGVRSSGLSAAIQAGFTSLFGGTTGGLAWLTGLSAVLSNLISNVPAVLLLSEVVEGAGGSRLLWLALASSSTLAGNATILGAAANVIVVQIASRDSVEVSMKDFVKAGLPVTVATLIVSTVLLPLLVPA